MTETFTLHAEFSVLDMDGVRLTEAAEALMEQLLALEEAGCGIHSSAVSVDLGKHIVEVEVATDADSFDVAYARVDSCVRAAIHATGGFTPDWDQAPQHINPELVSA